MAGAAITRTGATRYRRSRTAIASWQWTCGGTGSPISQTRTTTSRESRPELKETTAAAMASAPRRLMHTALASTLSEESMPAGPIPVPSLFVRAATLPASEDELKARYPGMEVVTVDAAHFVQMEKPE